VSLAWVITIFTSALYEVVIPDITWHSLRLCSPTMIYTAPCCITDYGQHYTCPPSTIPQSLSHPHSTHTIHRLTYQSSHPWTRSPVAGTLSPAATVDCAWAIRACAPRAGPAYRVRFVSPILILKTGFL